MQTRSAEECILLLQNMRERLRAEGADRFPRRSDFSEQDRMAIKARLGPWPRALEAAGLKEPRPVDRREQNREKRARGRERRFSLQNTDQGEEK